jgi:hypothetical protein
LDTLLQALLYFYHDGGRNYTANTAAIQRQDPDFGVWHGLAVCSA